jgi:protein-S-isoprenylcysteine O-methyltransferase Ste14
VRHPLYLFSLLAIWPSPIMTESLLAFNAAATLYFVVGSRLEEKRLIAAFGQTYLDYQRRVPWLIPGLH